MKPRVVELPSHKSSPPHCCVVSGRRDGPIIDFGDPTRKARGPLDPRVYLRGAVVEEGAKLLGMVPAAEVVELREKLAEAEAERERLELIVSAGADLTDAEGRLREALGPAPEPAAPDPGKE